MQQLAALTWLSALSAASAQAPAFFRVAAFGAYPGYAGEMTVGGSVNVSAAAQFSVEWPLMTGADPAGGGVHIHVGTTCDTAGDVGGHYYADSLATDPWAGVDVNDGSATRLIGGSALEYVVDHALVVHDSGGARIGCGLIGADGAVAMGAYPGYDTSADGAFTVAGTATVSLVTGQRLDFALTGADPAGGGIHIHTGTTCATAGDVGGHYFGDTLDADPWGAAGVYSGAATGSVSVASATSLASVEGKAVVIHDSAGARIGCGLLSDVTPAPPPPPPPAAAAAAKCSVTAAAVVLVAMQLAA